MSYEFTAKATEVDGRFFWLTSNAAAPFVLPAEYIGRDWEFISRDVWNKMCETSRHDPQHPVFQMIERMFKIVADPGNWKGAAWTAWPVDQEGNCLVQFVAYCFIHYHACQPDDGTLEIGETYVRTLGYQAW